MELLGKMQNIFVTGRPLEVSNPDVEFTGETNFIMVDRNNLLHSTFEKISAISNKCLTLEVQFYGEICHNTMLTFIHFKICIN